MPTLDIQATSNADNYWITIESQDVPMVDGQGSIEESAGTHYLFWYLTGDPGEKLSITVKSAGVDLTSVKSSSIPAGQKSGGGVKKFFVGGA